MHRAMKLCIRSLLSPVETSSMSVSHTIWNDRCATLALLLRRLCLLQLTDRDVNAGTPPRQPAWIKGQRWWRVLKFQQHEMHVAGHRCMLRILRRGTLGVSRAWADGVGIAC